MRKRPPAIIHIPKPRLQNDDKSEVSLMQLLI